MQKVHSTFGRFIQKATKVVSSKSKTLTLIQSAFIVLSANKTSLGGVANRLKLLLAAVSDTVSGKYMLLSKKSVLLIVEGILYLVSPIDVIPDFIFGIGFVDDIYVINLIFKRINLDLEEYQTWKTKQIQSA